MAFKKIDRTICFGELPLTSSISLYPNSKIVELLMKLPAAREALPSGRTCGVSKRNCAVAKPAYALASFGAVHFAFFSRVEAPGED